MKLADFRGDGSVEGWLVTMVANFCRRMRRGRKNDPTLHVEFDAESHGVGSASALSSGSPGRPPSPEHDMARGQLLKILSRALVQLDSQDRVLVLLSDAEGWKAPEIAEALDMTPGNVRTRLSRARKRLREHLGPLRDFVED